MYAVYKYYGDPALKVMNQKYTSSEYTEVSSLLSKFMFFNTCAKVHSPIESN